MVTKNNENKWMLVKYFFLPHPFCASKECLAFDGLNDGRLGELLRVCAFPLPHTLRAFSICGDVDWRYISYDSKEVSGNSWKSGEIVESHVRHFADVLQSEPPFLADCTLYAFFILLFFTIDISSQREQKFNGGYIYTSPILHDLLSLSKQSLVCLIVCWR